MLNKLFGEGSFGGSINHLACHQATFPISSNKFGLLSMVWIVTPTFLGCWALFILPLVIHFQQDDHLILLDVVAHVEIDISLFQMAP
jgi:hypothetical protein